MFFRFVIGLLIAALASGCTVRRTAAPESTRQLTIASVRRIIEQPALSPAAWSPEGSQLAYTTGAAVWVARMGGRPRKIAPAGVATALAWSGPLNLLAIIDQGAIWTMAPDGTGRRKLAIDGFAVEIAWSPGGDRLAAVIREAVDGGRYALWLFNRDGGFRRRVVGAPPNRAMRDLQWFPDGLYLLFGLSLFTDPLLTEAWQVRVSYPDRRRVPLRAPARFLRLAPTGRSIAYVAAINERTDQGSLVVSRLDGSGLATLASADIYGGLAWSPQGDKIAYAQMEPEARAQIWVVDADTSGRLRVLDYTLEFTDPRIGLSFAWTSDGRRVAFGTNTGSFTGPIWIATLSRR